VKNVQPSGCYPLRDGLKPGDVVRLIEFNCGHWTVELRDGRHTRIYMVVGSFEFPSFSWCFGMITEIAQSAK
jgi:hypothetical protein